MREVRILCSGIVGLMLAAGPAAADRYMVVLLDATGSMQTARTTPCPPAPAPCGATRYDQAKIDAAARVDFARQETAGLAKVAVYKFFGTGMVLETTGSPDGFVPPFDAVTAIENSTVTSGLTPLISSVCDSVDIARGSGTGATTVRFLEIYTDGAENNTNPAHACFGPSSVSTSAPFDTGPPPSWQNLAWVRTTNPLPAITVDATLYHNETLAPLAPLAGSDPESATLAALGRAPTIAPALAGFATDSDFFAALAADTGGNFTEVLDNQPAPVIADLDGNFVVDRNDAILLARQFGARATDEFDLNGDGKIGFADYQLLLKRFGNGSGTPEPDPYTQSPTINCKAEQTIRIEGKVIENAGITINGTGSCHVIIASSLIVSGTATITIRGSAVLEVDDSIIVGEGDWLRSRGSVSLSAAGSVFHGTKTVNGSFTYTDRGGNTFE